MGWDGGALYLKVKNKNVEDTRSSKPLCTMHTWKKRNELFLLVHLRDGSEHGAILITRSLCGDSSCSPALPANKTSKSSQSEAASVAAEHLNSLGTPL